LNTRDRQLIHCDLGPSRHQARDELISPALRGEPEHRFGVVEDAADQVSAVDETCSFASLAAILSFRLCGSHRDAAMTWRRVGAAMGGSVSTPEKPRAVDVLPDIVC
jgi:hypothetical protein